MKKLNAYITLLKTPNVFVDLVLRKTGENLVITNGHLRPLFPNILVSNPSEDQQDHPQINSLINGIDSLSFFDNLELE